MIKSMKTILMTAAAAVLAICFATSPALAQWKPDGPITMYIAFRAGGGTDTMARAIAEELQKRHGWEVVPQQLTGGGGAKLAVALKDQPNDGTVIGFMVTETYGFNMVANPRAGYTGDDMTPITTLAQFQMGLLAKSSKGWKTYDDVVAAAKSGQNIRFGTMSPKLSVLAELLGEASGVNYNVVEGQGGSFVMEAINADDVDIGFMAGIQGKGVASGELVQFASVMSKPLAQSPEAPTFADLGVQFNADGYWLVAAPKGLPRDARNALAKAIGDIISDPSTKAGDFAAKRLGGAVVIQGRELDRLLAKEAGDAKAMLAAVK